MCKQAEEAAAEAESQRLRDFRLELQRRVVQLQLGQRIAQRLEVVRLDRIQPGKDLRLHLLETGQRLAGRPVEQGDGVAHLGRFQFLDAGDHEAHFTRRKLRPVDRLGREHADVLGQVLRAGGHETNLVLGLQHAVDHPHQHHHADVVVEPRIDDQRLQRRGFVATRRRHLLHHHLQNFRDADAGLGRGTHRIAGIEADDVLDFLRHPVRVGGGQVDLVQHRDDFDAEIDRGIAVGHGLRFHALRGIHHQQRAFAGGERAANFVGKIDVAGGVDQVQAVDLAILRLVGQRGGLRLDGDAALPLEVHGIEHLRLHLAVGQAAAKLDDTISQRGLAVVDMGDDGKIADQILRHSKTGTFPCPARDEITSRILTDFRRWRAANPETRAD